MTQPFQTAAGETFERFLIEMDDRLAGFEVVAKKHGFHLYYFIGSLEDFETLVEKLLRETEAENGDATTVIITSARYLGEVMRLYSGGHWTLPSDDEKNVHYNQPVVTGHHPSLRH